MRQHPNRGLAAAGIALGWVAFYAAWLALAPERGGVRTVFAVTAYLLPLATAFALSLLAARRAAGPARGFWRLMTAATAAWLAADAAWCARDLLVGSVPFPWWSDAGYLVSYAFVLAAVYSAYRPRLRVLGPGRTLDTLLVVGSLGLLCWWLLVRPLDLHGGLEPFVAAAYPTLGLLLVGLLGATIVLPARQGSFVVRVVAAATGCGVVANGLYVRESAGGGFVAGDWIELGRQGQAVLLSLAAYAAVRGFARATERAPLRAYGSEAAAAVVAAALAAVVAVLVAAHAHASHAYLVCAAVLLTLSGARLALAARPRSLSGTDGVYGAGYVYHQLSRLVARGRHFGDGFALVVVALDEAVGEEDVAELGARLSRSAREVDVVGRLGGPRVAVLLPHAGADEALAIAERLRGAAAAAGPVSVGVAAWAGERDGASLLAVADAALRAARALGGNQARGAAEDAVLAGDGPIDAKRFELLFSLARLVDRREGSETEHGRAIAALSAQLAVEVGLGWDAIERAYVAGLLHDLGKVALPERLLAKPGPLDDLEWAAMTDHAERGAAVALRFEALRDAAPAIAAHHEHWDGAGYPRGLAGQSIPIEARIVAVADALVSMTGERPYRSARSETGALTAIWRGAGARYDPEVVRAVLALAREGRLHPEPVTAA
jgi:two-component system cell cycle response regulator